MGNTKNMKRIIYCLLVVISFPYHAYSQSIIVPNNDSTFISEFRDGDEWAVIARNRFVVGLGNKLIKDDYGSFYQIKIMVQNMTDTSYTFAPETISAEITNKNGKIETLDVLSNETFQKMIKRQQAWASAIIGFSTGLSAGMAGYQTSYISSINSNGYLYTQAVTNYNANNSFQANILANNQLMIMSKQMEHDKKIREEGYLKKTTIYSKEGVFGFMNIKRVKGTMMKIIIPINGENYIFMWNVTKKKS